MTAITKITSIALDETGNYTVNGLVVSGNTTSGNANLGNSVTANFFIGNGSLLTGLPAGYANSDVAAYLPTYTGNILAGNANLGNLLVANFFSGDGSLLTNITGGNVTGQISNALIAGTVYTNAQPNITSVGTLSNLTVTSNVATGNVLTDNLLYANGVAWSFAGSTYSNTNVAAYLPTYTGNISANYFIGNGSLLTSIIGGNVTGQVGNALIAGTVYTNAQPNITSVGTLSNLIVSGNVQLNGANVYVSNVANLNIPGGTANYVLKTDGAGNLSWTAQAGGGGGTPGGSNTQIQFNDSGNFAGTTGLTFDSTANRLSITNYSLTVNVLGNVTGATTINLNLGGFVTATATGIVTWTFSNSAASANASGFMLELTNGGSFTQLWPANVKWPSGVAPTLTGTGVDLLAFVTDDNGANWRGAASMLDSK